MARDKQEIKNAGIRVRLYTKHSHTGEDPALRSAWDRVVLNMFGGRGTGDTSLIRNPLGTIGAGTDIKAVDLLVWNAKYKNVQAYVQARGKALLQNLTNSYFTTLVTMTPHDTGNAIRNWQVIDATTGVAGEAYHNFKDDPVDRDTAVEITLALNSEVIEDLERYSKPRVINPAPYIDILDAGGSNQAPTGMTVHAEAAVNSIWQAFHNKAKVNATQTRGLLQKATESREIGSKARKR